MNSLHIALAVFAVLGMSFDQQGRAEEAKLVFERDIQPLLALKCGKCHSESVHKAGLDLSTIMGLRRGGESGDAAVAESVEDSPLWSVIENGEMPPDGEPALTQSERELIRRWIAEGSYAENPAVESKQITQHDVLPIVFLRCTMCHGSRRQEGGLDLRTPAAMQQGGASGPALVAGDPDASLMIQRVESEACPPRELLLKFFVKRPPGSEVQTIREWIAAGAPEIDVAADVATTAPDPLVTDEDRQHWAFQPPRASQHANSIDDFLLAKLHERGLTFSPEADRDTLIRRAHFDLHGLPPSVDESSRWRNDNDPHWYPKMIDSLLASPRYGERWGRYWLDLAGYADSEGGVSSDPIRTVAWKYRDYVIRAFNDDKPYDRFLLEQIAGDELEDVENARLATGQMVDNLIATGFLRMGIDQTGSRTMNFVPERLDVIGDAITILGEGLMGLTIGCAKCHSHKYDPIPQRDYYRFKAILQGALDEHDWLTFQNRKLEIDVPERHERVAQINPPLLARAKALQAELVKANANVQLELLRHHYPEQTQAQREETLRGLRIADNIRSQTQRVLVEKLQRVEILADSSQSDSIVTARQAVKEIENEILQVERQMEPPLTIRALWDRGEPSPTYLLRRGEHNKPGTLVGPGVPSVLTDGRTPLVVEPPFPDGTPKTGRRLAFANWLTDQKHPLTARVMVNRIWYHHFGNAIVSTLENFGVMGERPSHPELLDWLAMEFVRRGWSIKAMHRQMMNSQAYRQTSRITDERQQLDPQNRLVSRMTLRRMDAEVLRDSLLYVAGKIDETPGGPPDGVAVDLNGLVSVRATPAGHWRRSIYAQYRRTQIPSILDAFDYPQMGPNCLIRNVSTVSPQSLMLMNNGHVRDLATAFAARVQSEAEGETWQAWIDSVYQLALGRRPSEVERRLGSEALRDLETHWHGQRDKALQAYCHALLNSAAFIYID